MARSAHPEKATALGFDGHKEHATKKGAKAPEYGSGRLAVLAQRVVGACKTFIRSLLSANS